MKFRDLYKAVMNNRLGELKRPEALLALYRAMLTLQQERAALNKSIFSRKLYFSGKRGKYFEGGNENTQAKYGPWFNLIESDRIIKRLDTVSSLHEKVSIVKKHMKVD